MEMGTERREAATDAEDEEEAGAEQGEIVQTAGPAAESSAPVPASPQSSLAEPPGFSPHARPGQYVFTPSSDLDLCDGCARHALQGLMPPLA